MNNPDLIDNPFDFIAYYWKRICFIFLMICLPFFVKCSCLDFVDSYELGYKYDLRSGKITVINHTGYVLHAPWVVEVHTVDLRPLQVCINANSRVLNCKLVRFNPEGLQLFLSWHGRDSYSQDSLEPILMSYAYEDAGHTYPFLTVLREMRTEDSNVNQ